MSAGNDGITKIIDKFIQNFPKMVKRQVEKRIFELACKEKRAEDSSKVCDVR